MATLKQRMMRTAVRASGALNVRVYRASKGRAMGKMRGMPLLLLTVPGRRTGVRHTTALSYIEGGGGYVVVGSGGGAAAEPQWFRNLRAVDRAVMEVGSRRFDVMVVVAGPAQRGVLWAELVAKAPSFATYQGKVEREIPMAVLTPIQ